MSQHSTDTSTPDEEEDVTKYITEQLLCPVCDGYMCAPIRQCQTGHSLCKRCFLKVKKCPKCRAPKSDARCYTLEAIASKLKFPCRHSIVGCTFIGPGTELSKHEAYCKHAPILCPFRTYDFCRWQGFKNKLKAHCLEQHKNNFYLKERHKFLCENFINIDTYHYIYVIMCAYNEFFRLSWDLNEDTGQTRWALYFMGSKEDVKKFSYKIEFPSKPDAVFGDISRGLIWKSPCEILPENDSIKFHKHNYFMVHKELLADYCESNGDLGYRVNIYRSMNCEDDDEECKYVGPSNVTHGL